MHEMSTVRSTVAAIVAALPPDARQVALVRLRIGAWSSLQPDHVRMAFEAAAQGTALTGSHLEVEVAPVAVDCPTCGVQDVPDACDLRCPSCGEASGAIVASSDLQVVEVCLAAG